MGLSLKEILIVLLIVLLLFGASRIPAIARSLGKALGEFKKGTQEAEDELNAIAHEDSEDEEEEEEEKE